MDLGLKDRVAVVAASSKGLGRATAVGLAREGVKLCIFARGEEPLTATAEEIRRDTGVEVLAVPADVSKPEDIHRVVEETIGRFGRIDILVTNSGGPPGTTFDEASIEDFERAIDLNLMSTVRFCKEVVPHMQRQKWGRIVNIVSIVAKETMPPLILSSVSRPGILGLAKRMADELGEDGILVNSVCPGYTLTDRVKETNVVRARMTGLSEEEIMRTIAASIPVGRMGRPEEIANVVVFLASERASYVNGVAILVDGGQHRSIF